VIGLLAYVLVLTGAMTALDAATATPADWGRFALGAALTTFGVALRAWETRE